MSERKTMSGNEFDLLVRAMHREWKQDPKCILISGESTYYKDTATSLFTTCTNAMWIRIDGVEFECKRPVGFFSSKDRKEFDVAMEMLNEMRHIPRPDSVEGLICKIIPSAKDIIAEKALIDDHKTGR